MRTSIRDELATHITGEIIYDTPLAKLTTYRIGGPAAAVVRPSSIEDVIRVRRFTHETNTPLLVLGLGSNVLIDDRGFDGIVLRIGKGLDHISGRRDEVGVWSVGAGLPTPLLARRSANAGLAGVHRLVGVPGTGGGGVFMNAGAHGQDFSQVVREIEVVDPEAEVRSIASRDIRWEYRRSGLDGNIVVATKIALERGDRGQLEREIRQHFRWRKAGTPFDEPCCGSVFRNPPVTDRADGPRTAGQLIDACGLKGFRIGGAQVSLKHANYIVNVGDARAADVLAVIDAVRERVLKEYGVELQLEVRIIGAVRSEDDQ